MMKTENLPESWVTVHRAMQGHHDGCLEVAHTDIKDGAFGKWLAGEHSAREMYATYQLTAGFQNGCVAMAQPRAGVCAATPTGSLWSLRVFWSRLRLQLSLSWVQWHRFKTVEKVVQEHASSETWWVRCLVVGRQFRGMGLESRLLRQALAPCSDAEALLSIPQTGATRIVEERGGRKVTELEWDDDSTGLILYRIPIGSFH